MNLKWSRSAVWRPLLAAAWLFAVCPSFAQDAAVASDATAQAPKDKIAFVVKVEAPDNIRVFLERHLELQRYREVPDLTSAELSRLISAAEGNARDLLGTLGYFSAEVKITRQGPEIRVAVTPGPPTRITDVQIDFSGAITQDPEGQSQQLILRNSWALGTGKIFTQDAWDSAKSQALGVLTRQRYPTGRLADSRADIDPTTQSARLQLSLDSGPKFQLGDIRTMGISRYDPLMVANLSRLQSGSDYDQASLLEAQQRLANSGYFDSVYLSLDTTGDPAAAPVLVTVREARRQKIVLGVGVSTDGGPRLTLEHTHHRVPGLGWRALSKLALQRTDRSISTDLTSPPDEKFWSWTLGGLVLREEASGVLVNSQRYRVGRIKTIDNADYNYYLQYDRAREERSTGPVLADTLTANFAWTRRNFNNLQFPTDGWGLTLELGGGVTVGSSREPFFRTRARGLSYWPLDDVSTSEARRNASKGRIALRAEMGAVIARDGVVLPSTLLFLTGGDNAVRGYGLREIGVQTSAGQTVAGRYLGVASVEWQRPIRTASGRFNDWESTVFIDAGAVADQRAQLKAHVGVGAGLRWRSPVGPLQVDLAWGEATRKLRLHLNVGFTF
jgi:translocation and assembly module TamA